MLPTHSLSPESFVTKAGTPTYEREMYYTRQPQLLEIKKAMTQMILRLSGEVPIAVDLF